MKSCTIIISHYESIEFLRTCIRQIRKYAHPEIKQQILILDQSCVDTYAKVYAEAALDEDITTARTAPLYSGFGIDWAIRNILITSDYIAQLHVDAFPIHKNWLSLPIAFIENGLSFVGQHQFICDGTQSIYPPDPFFAMSQCFNVAKTTTYIAMSIEAGFTRFHNRPESGLQFLNNDWAEWASHDYINRGSDDDVVAFHWQDKYIPSNKLGLAITGMIGRPEDGSSFGRVIEDIVFHFGSARESIGVFDRMPQQYQDYYKKIQNGFTDELLNQMLSEVKPNNRSRTFWNGDTKKAQPSSEGLDQVIEYLKTL